MSHLELLQEWSGKQYVKETLALSRDLQRVMSAAISALRLRERDVLQYSLPMLRGYLDLLDDTGDQLLAQLLRSRQQQALDRVTSRIHYARQYLRSRLRVTTFGESHGKAIGGILMDVRLGSN